MMPLAERLLRLGLAGALAAFAACGRGERTQESGEALVDGQSPPALARTVERMLPALERLSGLDRREPLRVRSQPREAARAYMERRLAEEMPPEELEAVRRTYVALGLLPDTLDLSALLLDLYTEQVLGYYDPAQKTLFLVAGRSVRDLEPVLAHELVHALQDQHTNLDSLIARERGNDRQTAAHAAMEGHALLVMFAYLAEQATRRTVDPASLPDPARELAGALDDSDSEYPVFSRAPAIIRETLLFPYVGGASFVHALWSSLQPRERYPAPIDTLLPQSTEQVLRPRDRFIGTRDEPHEVTLPPPPTGWAVVHENQLGQLEVGIFLEQHLGAGARHEANGWDGDRYRLLERDGADILDWWSVWDDEASADRFAEALLRTSAARTSRHLSVERRVIDGRPGVRIVDAPAGTELRPLIGAAAQ